MWDNAFSFGILAQEAVLRDTYERVERGAKLLDSVDTDWFNAIDISSLNLHDPWQCICGQLFVGKIGQKYTVNGSQREYESGFDYASKNIYAIMDDESMGGDYGFNFKGTFIHAFGSGWSEWEYLAQEWAMQIEKRIANS